MENKPKWHANWLDDDHENCNGRVDEVMRRAWGSNFRNC